MSTAARGARIARLLIGLAALLTVLGLVAVAAQPAQALASYAHGDITDWDCGVCHLNGHPRETPVSEVCLTCHTGFSLPRRDLLCWTCHTPGQDMSRSRDNAACTSACHLPDGSIVTHTAHPDRSADCASCHAVSASRTDPAGSPHHTIPAPALDGLSPASGSPGVVVTLKGSHFANVVAVRFGDVDAAFVVDSLTQISAVVPGTAITGPVRVLTAGGIATSSADFVVLRPEPLTLKLTVSRASLTLGGRVRLAGRRSPAGEGDQVTIVVQRRVAGVWRAAATSLRTTDTAGAFAWSYRPRRVGAYRTRAKAADVASGWVAFRVR